MLNSGVTGEGKEEDILGGMGQILKWGNGTQTQILKGSLPLKSLKVQIHESESEISSSSLFKNKVTEVKRKGGHNKIRGRNKDILKEEEKVTKRGLQLICTNEIGKINFYTAIKAA